ncbi:MAG: aquaporin [Chloroflexota bacterium]|jgi:aquaporin Z|nr:aquaporin [Chloroflexota bacterium]
MRTPSDPGWPRRLTAEAFGTFALVFVAVGGDAMNTVSGGQVSVAARAVAPALMVAALIYAMGDVSGAHLNPVVSLAFTLKRLFPVRWLIPYWASQFVGAVAASLVVGWLFGDAVRAGVSTPHVPDATAVVLEIVLTWLLVTVIQGTADRHRIVGPDAAIAVGATIALCGLIALPIDGASMNPARSFGPALVAGDLSRFWIYLVGPIVGAALAVLLTRFLHGPTEIDAKAAEAAQGRPQAE